MGTPAKKWIKLVAVCFLCFGLAYGIALLIH
jgi:hypothetical protein